jgi:exosortase
MSTAPLPLPPRAPAPPAMLTRVALAAAVALAHHRTFMALAQTWQTNENYSHGPLVPLVVAWLVWDRRDRLREVAVAPDGRGLALTALACVLHLVGVRADLFALQGWSLLPLAMGLVVTFLGWRHARMLLFPVLYLGFMLTFPPIVMDRLSFELKGIALHAATWAATALGTEMRVSAMSIFVGGGELRVEDPCSGLRSLLALLATGTLFAYLQPGGGWRRCAVLLATVPIAVGSNILRLLALILAADARGVVWAAGAFHDAVGYALYAVALLALVGLRGLLTPRGGAR